MPDFTPDTWSNLRPDTGSEANMLLRRAQQTSVIDANLGDQELGDNVTPLRATQSPGVALALGGGAARGWSHIGVLRAFEEAGISVNMIAGTSVGALVGACYLAGKLDELEEFARGLTRRKLVGFLDISLRGSGLISGMKLAERMKEHLNGVEFNQLSRPFYCVATEITTGHEIWLSDGPVIDSIRASYALPGIFEPVIHENRILVDGALVNPVPVSVCRAHGSQMVVAVNLNSDINGRARVIRNKKSAMRKSPISNKMNEDQGEEKKNGRRSYVRKFLGGNGSIPSLSSVMVESFNIIQDRIARSRLAGDPPDLTIGPGVAHIGLAEFHKADEAIEIGYSAAKARIDDIKCLSEAMAE